MLAVEFARFLGLQFAGAREPHRRDQRGLRHRRPHPGRAGLVDEMHNLYLATRAGAEVSDS